MNLHHVAWLYGVWLVLGQPPPATASPNGAWVFVLHSYSQEYAWTKRQHEGFISQLVALGKSDLVLEAEYLFDARQLIALGLTLPQEIRDKATLLNQPPSRYQRYRGWFVGVLVALAGLLVLSLAAFLFVLSRKNRVIQQRSLAFAEQAELALQAKDSVNESQRLARLGTWEWDIETGLFTPSDGLAHLCGMSAGAYDTNLEIFLRRLPGEDAKQFSAATAKLREKAEFPTFSHRLQHTDGRVITVTETMRLIVDDTGKPQCLIGTVQDVTEQYRAKALLRENEVKYQRLFELSQDPMWLISGGRFIMANKASGNFVPGKPRYRMHTPGASPLM